MIEGYKSYSAALFKDDKKSGSSESFDPFAKGFPIKWGAHLYKICLIYSVLKWVLCIKFSRAIFACKKVKCNIYATVTNMLLFKKMIPSNPSGFGHKGCNGAPTWAKVSSSTKLQTDSTGIP